MLSLRRAKIDDWCPLFQWVNSPDALAGKLLTEKPIDLDTHILWFAKRLDDPNTFLWMIELSGEPIGQLRFMKNEMWEIDIYLRPEFRGRGFAQSALENGSDELRLKDAESILRAVVKLGNVRSMRLFERAGFKLREETAGFLVYDRAADHRAPQRIHRKRTKGWRMPPNTVSVTRPSIFGNPFPVDVYRQDGAVDLFRRWLCGPMSMRELSECSTCHSFGDISMVTLRSILRESLPKLRGKNLACFCALDKPCHADVLLELAN